MWPDGEGIEDEHPGRISSGSEVAVLNGQAHTPMVSTLNVHKSTGVHVGPQIYNVTQNVHNTEVIKDLAFPRYLWTVMKNTTRTERLSCVAAVILITLCIFLTVYYTVARTNNPANDDVAPHEWNITRKMWLALPYNQSDSTAKFEPLRLVIIQHSVSPVCRRFDVCAAELRNLQSWFLQHYKYDIPYNFLIGNDGRVYEGRGWSMEGAHTKGFNRCSLGIGFIGDYRQEIEGHVEVTNEQLQRALMLFEEGVKLGHLHPNFFVMGAKDLGPSESPGSSLYEAIKKWPNYDHQHRFKGKKCDEIYAPRMNNE